MRTQQPGIRPEAQGNRGRLGNLDMSALDALGGTRIPAEKLKVTPCDGNCGSCGRCQDAKKGRMEIQFLPQVDLGALESLMQGEAAGRAPAVPGEGAGRVSDRHIELDLRRTRLREGPGHVEAILNPMETEETRREKAVTEPPRPIHEVPQPLPLARIRPQEVRDGPPAATPRSQIPQLRLEPESAPAIRDSRVESMPNVPEENRKKTPVRNAIMQPEPSQGVPTPVYARGVPVEISRDVQRSHACEGTIASISTMALRIPPAATAASPAKSPPAPLRKLRQAEPPTEARPAALPQEAHPRKKARRPARTLPRAMETPPPIRLRPAPSPPGYRRPERTPTPSLSGKHGHHPGGKRTENKQKNPMGPQQNNTHHAGRNRKAADVGARNARGISSARRRRMGIPELLLLLESFRRRKKIRPAVRF